MRRSLTSVPLPFSRLRCHIVRAFDDSQHQSRFAVRSPCLAAVSTSIAAMPVVRTKRGADKQEGGKWRKRQVWTDRHEGSRTRENRERAQSDQQTSSEDMTAGSSEAGEKRLPKRKGALLFGYNGSGYAGLQIQTGSKLPTVEAVVADAILRAGGMLAANRQQLSKINWQRCARTDKGVHALTNLLSLNLITQPDGLLEVHATLTQPNMHPCLSS